MFELDSNNLRENGEKFLKLVNELETNINYIYNRIDGMTAITGEWQGISAKKFITNSRNEKKQIKNFIVALRSYGNSLINQTTKIELCAKKVEL